MDKQMVLEKLTSNLEEIRQRFSVSEIAIFGSLARGEPTPRSDIDILVTFEQKATFDGFMDLKFYLEQLLAAPVDLVTDNALRPQVREAIEQEVIRVA